MSACTVSKQHIDAVVMWLIIAEIIDEDQADETGAALWQANHDNVSYRYGVPATIPPYLYSRPLAELEDDESYYDPFDPSDPSHGFKLTRSLRYQSCDMDGWNESREQIITAQLLAYFTTLGVREDDKAPWLL